MSRSGCIAAPTVRSATMTPRPPRRRAPPPSVAVLASPHALRPRRRPPAAASRDRRRRRGGGLRALALREARGADPDARRRRAVHRHLHAERRRRRRATRSSSTAPRTRCARTAPTATRSASAPPTPTPGRASSSSTRTCAARTCPRGTFVNMRPIEENKGPRETDESTDTWDTIDWLVKHLDEDNGKVGLWGISYPGFYASAGAIHSHPALAAVSPQAPIADWFWDDMHHHGAFILPLAFDFFASFGQPRPEPTTKGAERFDPRHAGRLPLLPRPRAAVERQRALPARRGRLLEPARRAPELRRLLAVAQPPAPPRRRHRAGDDGRRLVRRRGPLRAAPHLPCDRGQEPRDAQHAGDGPVAARRLDAHRRPLARRRRLRLRHRRVVRRPGRAALLPPPPQGRPGPAPARGADVRDRRRPLAPLRPLAAGRPARRGALPAERTEGCRSTRRRRADADAQPLRQLRLRPRAPGALHHRDDRLVVEALHDRGPALRLHRARTSWSTRASRSTTTSPSPARSPPTCGSRPPAATPTGWSS